MPFPTVEREEYEKEGAKKGLVLIGATPESIRAPGRWRCIYCRDISEKTLRAVRVAQYGCPCQKPEALSYDRYPDLAERLGIEWVGTFKPRNIKTPTQWKNTSNGAIVQVTYYQLAYHHIREDIKTALGIFDYLDLPERVQDLLNQLGAGAAVTPDFWEDKIVQWLLKYKVISQIDSQTYKLTGLGDRLLKQSDVTEEDTA
jgi:hypothetical protein